MKKVKIFIKQVRQGLKEFTLWFNSLKVKEKIWFLLLLLLCVLTTTYLLSLLLGIISFLIPVGTLIALYMLYVKLEDWGNKPVTNNKRYLTFSVDYEVALACVYEMAKHLCVPLGLACPSSIEDVRSVLYYSTTQRNRLHFVMLKKALEGGLPLEKIRQVLNEELKKYFCKFAPNFQSDVQGLYVDFISDTMHSYEITIVAINDANKNYIAEREQALKKLNNPSDVQNSTPLEEDEF